MVPRWFFVTGCFAVFAGGVMLPIAGLVWVASKLGW